MSYSTKEASAHSTYRGGVKLLISKMGSEDGLGSGLAKRSQSYDSFIRKGGLL